MEFLGNNEGSGGDEDLLARLCASLFDKLPALPEGPEHSGAVPLGRG